MTLILKINKSEGDALIFLFLEKVVIIFIQN